jgi:hypothetical protein
MSGSCDMLVEISSGLFNPDGSDSMPEMKGNVFIGEKGQRFGVLNQGKAVALKYDEKIAGKLGARYADNVFATRPECGNVRSAQVHALCPMMQISASPWRVLDAKHQAIFSNIVALRQKFAPKFAALAKKAGEDGEPILRSLEYNYPGQGYAAVIDQFMMGEDLLVAPVLKKGASSRSIVLPPGRWLADDGKTYAGPTEITVKTPLSRLPHFTAVR